jgi:hypothetical protein
LVGCKWELLELMLDDHGDVAKAFASNRANHPLGIRVCDCERGAMTASRRSNVLA